ncbi:MAG TPA: sugar phosphate isomerase/epimerase family protein [Rectinemataceae bacterium]
MAYSYSFSTAALFPRTASDSLKLVAQAGFQFAELMPQCFAESRESFALEAEKSGLRVASVHYPLAMFSLLYNASPGMAAEARSFGTGLVKLCSALQARVLVVHPHEPAKDPAYRELLEKPIRDNLKALGDECGAAGITLAVENNPKGPGRTAEGLLEYIRSLGAGPAAHPMVDTTEAVEAAQDPAEFIRAVNPWHTHLSDHKGEAKHIPAGQGENDWKAIRSALVDTGYSGVLTLEPLYRFYLDDPVTRLRGDLEFIRSLMEGAA